MIGETLGGKYAISRLIGEGGMGAVYEGRHTGTGRRVAIKVITGDIARNPKLAQRFEVEARAAGTIESEHVVAVLDVGHDERGAPFLVMEYLTGEDLDGLLARVGQLAPDAAVKIAAQACFGLAQAHALGIVHRDIKPGNIFLCARDGGRVLVKLVDFGVAKLADSAPGAAKLTRAGTILGSPLYMSPEQARAGQLDHRTDLWSLGVVLYEMLAGRTPFHDVEALPALVVAICMQPPPPLRGFAPWVDPALAAVVERALAIDPDKRYSSAAEMADALRALSPGGSTELYSTMLKAASPRGGPAAGDIGFARTTAGEPLFASGAEGARVAAAPQAITPPDPAIAPLQAGGNEAARGSMVPVAAAAGVLLAAGGLAAAFAMGWLGGGSGPSIEVEPKGSAATPGPAVMPSGSVAPARASPLAALIGVWKSESGRVYDAVAAGDGVELRLRDASQLPGQGYEDGEARFVLTAIPNEASTFGVEDRVRPLPPERIVYDMARARPTCLVTWTEVQGKPLRARLSGDKLTMDLVVFKADKTNFVLEGGRVVRCEGLGRASVSETTSVLVRER